MKRVVMQIPAEAEYLDIVRLGLYGIASKMGFSYEDIEDMKVAVGEACNNAILHAYPENDDSQLVIDIVFESDDAGLTIRVKDAGQSFAASAELGQAVPHTAGHVSELEVGGLGLYLMQALMDEVEIHTKQGTEVIMTKHLAVSH